MKKRVLPIIVFLSLAMTSMALPNDSIETTYRNGEFFSQYQTKVKGSGIIASEVTNDLLKDFHNKPNNLFNWALKGLGLQEEKKNELIFVLKSSISDAKTGITHGKFDIIVPHIKTFNDVIVDVIVSKTKYNNGEMKVTANIIYSSLLLKNALGVLTIVPQKNNELLFIASVKIKFGWFFNIFITKKRYKNIVEWRIKKFTENLKEECMHREAVKLSY
ncbi:MAG: hypothetical protein Q8904_03490 [Bacteroidota bacterium]|nr:hypothetical protein [Bacteroidota bacterium]